MITDEELEVLVRGTLADLAERVPAPSRGLSGDYVPDPASARRRRGPWMAAAAALLMVALASVVILLVVSAHRGPAGTAAGTATSAVRAHRLCVANLPPSSALAASFPSSAGDAAMLEIHLGLPGGTIAPSDTADPELTAEPTAFEALCYVNGPVPRAGGNGSVDAHRLVAVNATGHMVSLITSTIAPLPLTPPSELLRRIGTTAAPSTSVGSATTS